MKKPALRRPVNYWQYSPLGDGGPHSFYLPLQLMEIKRPKPGYLWSIFNDAVPTVQARTNV